MQSTSVNHDTFIIYSAIIIIIIIINEKISVAFSPKTARTRRLTHKKDDMFGRQRKKQKETRRSAGPSVQVANQYFFKCRLKVDSDDDDVTNDGKLIHARAAATGKARSQILSPRSRTTEDGAIVAVPTRKGTCGIWNCLRLNENQRISVLAGLSWSLLERVHKLTSTTHAETLLWSSDDADGEENPHNYLRVVCIKVRMLPSCKCLINSVFTVQRSKIIYTWYMSGLWRRREKCRKRLQNGKSSSREIYKGD